MESPVNPSTIYLRKRKIDTTAFFCIAPIGCEAQDHQHLDPSLVYMESYFFGFRGTSFLVSVLSINIFTVRGAVLNSLAGATYHREGVLRVAYSW